MKSVLRWLTRPWVCCNSESMTSFDDSAASVDHKSQMAKSRRTMNAIIKAMPPVYRFRFLQITHTKETGKAIISMSHVIWVCDVQHSRVLRSLSIKRTRDEREAITSCDKDSNYIDPRTLWWRNGIKNSTIYSIYAFLAFRKLVQVRRSWKTFFAHAFGS